MKLSKFIVSLAAALLISVALLSTGVFAEIGDVTGSVYSTDIVTYIDSMPAESFNIGGKTAVIAEDLVPYGFDVIWNGEARRLVINTIARPANAPDYTPTAVSKWEIGRKVGDIYETDIVCYVNGMIAESYNIGGKTAVVVEDMATYTEAKRNSRFGNIYQQLGYAPSLMKCFWNGETRELNLHVLRPGDGIYLPSDVYVPLSEKPFTYSYYSRSTWLVYDKSTSFEPQLLNPDGIPYIEINGCYYAPIVGQEFVLGMKVSVKNGAITVDFDRDENGNPDVPSLSYMRNTNSLTGVDRLIETAFGLNVLGKYVYSETPVAYVYMDEIYVNINAVNDALSAYGGLMKDYYAVPDGIIAGQEIDEILYTSTLMFINDRSITCYDGKSGCLYVSITELKNHGFTVDRVDEDTWNVTSPASPLPLTDEEKNLHPEDYYRPNTRSKMFDVYNGIHDVTINGEPVEVVYINDCTVTYDIPCIEIGTLAKAIGARIEEDYQNGYIFRLYTK